MTLAWRLPREASMFTKYCLMALVQGTMRICHAGDAHMRDIPQSMFCELQRSQSFLLAQGDVRSLRASCGG